MMRRFLLLLAALSVSACYPDPPNARPAPQDVVEATRWAYESVREPLPACPYLGRILVTEWSAEETQNQCARPVGSPGVAGCVNIVGGGNTYTHIVIQGGLSPRTERGLLVHELLHAYRACDVSRAEGTLEYLDYYYRGATDCNPATPMDHSHCDREMWGEIQALALWRLPTIPLDGGL